ncbi:MAG TPA: hypothetical protein P5052_03110 [Candidatus Paceibacterota bacterium]|nr:hypothetical protein [Candidatus Paceibacterota bacterium]HRZ29718.1 hypothetical protein [Candidatus Paceibacterota bacterium]
MMDRPGGDFIDGHGVFGEIIKISDNQIIINGQDKIEKIINIAKDTKIISFNQEIKLDQLKINDRIMILGDSNDQGKIDAKLIRVFNQPTPTSFKP